ncbi:hypothetical protein GCM10010400_05820 [Streptomyces aculeolatus]|uniref:DUF6879 family protein n=1 Tax=Streptomyces aculeolatus TaxID=270689 RepID=UPI001CEC31D2|nr:DUF6879 family protein [Streptomyces aculeolatus]
MNSIPEFAELLADAKQSAVHLEMRDRYFSNPRFEAWQRGHRVDWEDRASWWRPFHDDVAAAVSRGVSMRRARVVSEPVTQYIRWEHYVTTANVKAGESVRWLPRRHTADLLLPGCDFWIFDDRFIRIHHFSGDGQWVDKELQVDPSLVESCAAAFEKVWARAIPHDKYEIQ